MAGRTPSVHGMSDAMNTGQIGRQLPRRFREAKLEDVTYRAAVIAFPYDFVRHMVAGSLVGAVSIGATTEAEGEVVLAGMERAERELQAFKTSQATGLNYRQKTDGEGQEAKSGKTTAA